MDYNVFTSNGAHQGADLWPLERLPELYDSLAMADDEHGQVAVRCRVTGSLFESAVTACRDGSVVLETGPRPDAFYLPKVAKAEVLELWHQLIRGDRDAVFRRPWLRGYPWSPE